MSCKQVFMKLQFVALFAALGMVLMQPMLSNAAQTAATGSAESVAEELSGSTVYQRLYEEFSRYPNRLVGTTNLANSFSALETELRAAGLDPRRQTFSTIIQETEYCRLTLDGKPIEEVMMVENGLSLWTGKKPYEGPLVYVGAGRASDVEGMELKGSIAVVDMTKPGAGFSFIFPLGVQCVIIVGDETTEQWAYARLFPETSMLIPAVFVPREAAASHGMLEADGTRMARIEARTRHKDTEGSTMYVVLPGDPKWRGDLNSPETILLSATVDTCGFVPEYTPDLRRAANAALLAQVLCNLADKPRNRTIVAAFWGGSYSSVEAARHFYYAISMADKSVNSIDLNVRADRLALELDDIERLAMAIASDHVLDARHGNAFSALFSWIKVIFGGEVASGSADDGVTDSDRLEVARRFKRVLQARVFRQRSRVGKLNHERTDIKNEIESLRSEKTTELQESAVDAEARIETLTTRIADLDALLEEEAQKKLSWNNLQGQIAMRRLMHDDPTSVATFNEVRSVVLASIEKRQAEIKDMIRHNATGIQLSDVFTNQTVVGHFEFDFAKADKPWLFSMINGYGPVRSGRVDTSSYLNVLMRLGEIYADSAASGESGDAPLFKPALTPYFKPFSLNMPAMRQAPSVVSVALGMAGFQMMTVGDRIPLDELPFRGEFDLEPLTRQMTSFSQSLADDGRLSLRRDLSRELMEDRFTYLRGTSRDPQDIYGIQYQDYAPGSSDFEGPSQNAIAFFGGFSTAGRPVGRSIFPRTRIQSNGYIYMPMISRGVATTSGGAFGFGYAEDGGLERVSITSVAVGTKTSPIPLFHAYGGFAYSWGFIVEPLGGELYANRVLLARTDASYRNTAMMWLHGPPEIYVDKDEPIKRFSYTGRMILGATPDKPTGYGVPIADNVLLNFDGIDQCARDYWQINEMRLRALRQRNIISDDLETLHADVREHLDAAAIAKENKSWGAFQAHNIFATSLANRAYAPLRGVTTDLVHAVVVLLLLNIPFAFALERLIFGFTSIYRQVMGFSGFFLATFGILFVTHPAFTLASAPIVIFLAFVIILLSSMTVAIVMGKVRQEIRAIQGLASTAHGVESDNSTTLAAVLIGISGMRNRPLKTFLTAVTVALLTFTILVFASFSSRLGVVETYLGEGQGEDRIELHRYSFLDIDKQMVSSIRTLYEDDYHVFSRGGIFRIPVRPAENGSTPLVADRVLYAPRTGKTVEIGAVMGLEPEELACNPPLKGIAPNFADVETPFPPMFLSPVVTDSLGIKEGDDVYLNGYAFTFAGVTDGALLKNLSTIDDFKIVPPDYTSTLRNVGRSETAGMNVVAFEEMDMGNLEWYSADNLALVRFPDLRRVFAGATESQMLVLYPRRPDVDLEKTTRELAPVFRGAVHVKSSEGARRMFFTKAVEGSGFRDVMVPLLLGGLIIFSSLMGSIVDREREIFTYSALGLAPPDVGTLFFAESAVYSVIGGMGGYLFSQVVAKLLTWLGHMGVLTMPEMNFSSLTSVLTILVVMMVVMLSTIYPAIKAGKSANPGVARRWKMPAPDGDNLSFVFPFTVSEMDFSGILSFIREHFGNHSDAALGSFAAKEINLFRRAGGKGTKDSIGIEANISLAPFDLGIFQRFRMYSQEFEIDGIDEVVVELERIGGTPSSWVRSNRAFADELRQQFLLWRSLPIATIEHYRAQTEATLGISHSAATDPESSAPNV